MQKPTTSRSLAANSPKRAAFAAGIVGPLELAKPVRLKAVRLPEALPRTDADATPLGHCHRSPVRRLARRRLDRKRHNAFGDFRAEWRNTRRARFVAPQPVHPLLHETLLPAPDGGLGHANLSHDLRRAAAFAGQHHNLRPPGVLLRTVAINRNGDKPLAVGGGDLNNDTCAHAPDSHITPRDPHITPNRGKPK